MLIITISSFLTFVIYPSRISSDYLQGFDGLASLALLRQGMKDKSSDGVFDWNVTGASICYLGLEVHFLSQSCMKLYACLQFIMLTSLLIMRVAHEKFE
jgi:hypothetical protein